MHNITMSEFVSEKGETDLLNRLIKKMTLKKTLISFVLTLTILFTSLWSPVKADSYTANAPSTIHVSWKTVYASFNEMLNDVDLVAYGSVINQEYILQNDGFVYTKTTVQVIDIYLGNNPEEFTVYQLGGILENHNTPYPTELPKLPMNETCIFMCERSNNNYWIAGASQGIFYDILLDDWNTAILQCGAQFQEKSENPIGNRATVETPINAYPFPTSTSSIQYLITGSVNSIPSSCATAIANGLYSWKGCLPMSYTRVYTTPVGPSVTINVVNTTNPTSPNIAGTTIYNSVYNKTITLYEGGMNNPTDANEWKKVACHEMGHALGLDHNTLNYSVMHPYVSQMAAEPQYPDILAIRELYGY